MVILKGKLIFARRGRENYGFVCNFKGTQKLFSRRRRETIEREKIIINTGILEHSKSWNKYWKQNSMSQNLLNKYCKQIPQISDP